MDSLDPSTDAVLQWIRFLGHDCQRLNGDALETHTNDIIISSTDKFELKINKRKLTNNYYSVWYRRWSRQKNLEALIKLCEETLEVPLAYSMLTNYSLYSHSIENTLINQFKSKRKLTAPHQTRVFKLNVLLEAKKLNINIPEFILTTRKTHLKEFFKLKKERVIIKDLDATFYFKHDNVSLMSYTELITPEKLETLPDEFHITFFQEYIEKEYEIRTFVLGEKLYSMAIFSQADKETEIDFRRYNNANPNRTVPCKLPKEIEEKLTKLMRKLKLETGSIDIIKNRRGEYFFLEINPIGQYGMVSEPCNYNLDYEIANYLTL